MKIRSGSQVEVPLPDGPARIRAHSREGDLWSAEVDLHFEGAP